MKVLKESEAMPISFLTEFIAKSWANVGELKEDAKILKEQYNNSEKIVKILDNLVDAYLISIGQLENYLNSNKYLDIKKDTITEDVSSKEDVATISALIKDEKEAIDGYNAAAETLKDEQSIELMKHIRDDELEHIEELSNTIDNIDGDMEVHKVSNTIDPFSCDFEDPKGDAITDADLYGKQPEAVEIEPNDTVRLQCVADKVPTFEKPSINLIDDAEKPELISDESDWNCEFDEPVGEPLTDEDLYKD